MIVGTCVIELYLPGVQSLKEKRSHLKSIVAQVQKKFNASVAEVDFHDVWQSASIGIAVVSNNRVHADQMVENIVEWIETHRPDVDVVGHRVETIAL
jgi:uncharacterized protein YlxP (DUF503 family)